jgi:hypothetical protein
MERTWKPIAAGILCIIVGAIVVAVSGMIFALGLPIAMTSDEPIGLLILIFFGIPLIVFGILAVVGGIYALRRRRWGLALAGSISGLIFGIPAGVIGAWLSLMPSSDLLVVLPFVVFGLLGLLALIFVIRGKREFK